MLIPRRRVTSLTILSVFVFAIWYFLGERSVYTDGVRSAVGAKFKTRPEEGKLAPDALTKAETTADPSLLSDVPPTILIDSRRPPPGVENADKIVSAQEKQAAQQEVLQKPRWNWKQYTRGRWHFVSKYPLETLQDLPKEAPSELPKVQFQFATESAAAKETRLKRLDAVKESFDHSWAGYKKYAWKQDELRPIEGGSHQSFGGWAATLVDSLDTLWIMGLTEEFEEAVDAVKDIDFTETDADFLNLFETTIRYLGGFLGAYDMSDGAYPVLLEKATEVGDLLYCAFDTPNRMPVTRWPWKSALQGEQQVAGENTLIAEIGSLTLEFTRLSQITGDPKYHDATARIMKELQRSQSKTHIPGLWPTAVNAKELKFNGFSFTFGGMADSLYEYLPKQHMLLGGKGDVDYESMYKTAITAAMNHIFFQPMTRDGVDILFPGNADVFTTEGGHEKIVPKAIAQHLGCYAGGMVGLGAKIFEQPEHMNMARKLVDGCAWAYKTMPTGIMPELFEMIPCKMNSECTWNETKWEDTLRTLEEQAREGGEGQDDASSAEKSAEQIMKQMNLKPGFTKITDPRYILRPEAIESVFIHYRLTGETDLLQTAWNMFQSIENATRTDIANAPIEDVRAEGATEKVDSMESFWLAETLKYFYLIFSEPDVVDLDSYVLNTEAHPLKRPTSGYTVGSSPGS